MKSPATSRWPLALLALLLALSGGTAAAQLGALDPKFRNPGRVMIGAGTVNGTSVAHGLRMGMAVQGDGKIVLTTGNVLMRLLPDGALDTSFGTGGRLIHPGGRTGAALLLQSDRKIVVAGANAPNFGSSVFTVMRYLPDGTLDTAFGAGGAMDTLFPFGRSEARAIALQGDGRIVVAGKATASSGKADFAIACYLPTGILDPSFDGDGLQTVDFFVGGEAGNTAYGDSAYGVAVRPDGKIIVSGEVRIGFSIGGSQFGSLGWDLGEARLSASGTVEAQSFYRRAQNQGFEYGGRVALQADGSSVLIGYGSGLSSSPFRAGIFFPVLGGSGLHESIYPTLSFEGRGARGLCVAIQSDGKIVLAGAVEPHVAEPQFFNDFAIIRLNADGVPDTTFSDDAMASVDIASSSESADQVAVLDDGRILLAGVVDSAGPIALTRLLADGTVDETFGAAGGRTFAPTLTGSTIGRAMAIQPDGKIVATGTTSNGSIWNCMTIARFLPDGKRDPGFGKYAFGREPSMTSIPSLEEFKVFPAPPSTRGNALALQPDGKIVVAGSIDAGLGTDFHVARLNSAGILDTSFSGDGRVSAHISDQDEAYGVAVQSDGRIVVVGESGPPGARDFTLLRFEADGQPDPTFGTMGRVLTDFGVGDDSARAVAIQPDGKIVVAGTAADNFADFALARYLPDGSLDTTFGDGDGLVTTHSFFNDAGHAVALQPDGKIIVAGTSGGSTAGVFRYLADGTLDPAFGAGGYTGAVLTSGLDVAYGVVVQANGRIVIAGHGTGGVGGDFILARFNSDGSLDTSFNANGRVATDFHGAADGAHAVALTAAGDIVLAGFAGNGTGNNFALARLQGSDPDIRVETAGAPPLVSGASAIAMPALLVGGESTRLFTIRNVGGDALTGLDVTFAGGHSVDFTVATPPVSPVAGPAGSTTFVVRLTSASAGHKTTQMTITSNDHDEPSFQITLAGTALTPGDDYDMDGVNNAAEFQLTSLGFDPLIHSGELRDLVRTSGPGLGLYVAEDMEALALGAPVLTRNAVTGNFHLRLRVEQSPNLALPGSWQPLIDFIPTHYPATGEIDLEFAPGPGGAHFYRVLGRRP